jgi:hypothetical protein
MHNFLGLRSGVTEGKARDEGTAEEARRCRGRLRSSGGWIDRVWELLELELELQFVGRRDKRNEQQRRRDDQQRGDQQRSGGRLLRAGDAEGRDRQAGRVRDDQHRVQPPGILSGDP